MPVEPDQQHATETLEGGLSGSWLGLKFLAVPFLVAILVGGVVLTDLRAGVGNSDGFVCTTADRWRKQFGEASSELRVIRVDVAFRGRAKKFGPGEGVVVAATGLDLDGLQKVVATAADPPGLGSVLYEGIQNQVWEYAGKLHRDINYTALTLVHPVASSYGVAPPTELVENEDGEMVEVAMLPELNRVGADVLYESGLSPELTRDHSLEQCQGFDSWATQAAASGDAMTKFARIANRVAKHLVAPADDQTEENVCTAIREQTFTPHQAQVALVMGARHVGLSAFAITGAQPERRYLASVWAGRRGWLLLDLEDPETGYLDDAPALLAKAPVLAEFAVANHGFWNPTAVAYTATPEDGAYAPIVRTAWQGPGTNTADGTPTTHVRTFALAEVCR